MEFVIYVSAAVKRFSRSDLNALLAVCVHNNHRDAITGMLLYKDGNFLQVIEGIRQKVCELQGRIERDPRHGGMIVLMRGPVVRREFAGWAMGFHDLSVDKNGNRPGYSEFMNTTLTGAEFLPQPTRAQRLLLCFKSER